MSAQQLVCACEADAARALCCGVCRDRVAGCSPSHIDGHGNARCRCDKSFYCYRAVVSYTVRRCLVFGVSRRVWSVSCGCGRFGLNIYIGQWPLAPSFPSVRKIPRKFLRPGIPHVCRPSPLRPTWTLLVLVVNLPSMLRLTVLGSVSPLVACRCCCPLVSSGFPAGWAGCVGGVGVVVRSWSRVGVAAAVLYIHIRHNIQ